MATTKEYHDYVYDSLSRVGNIRTRKMMGEYLVYYKEKLIGNVCDNTVFIKETATSIKLLKECEMDYPYEGSKTLMYMLEELNDYDLLDELLNGMYEDLLTKRETKKK